MVVSQPKHRDCTNFKDGKCLLYGVTVPPDGPACPNFTPRTQAAIPGTIRPVSPSPATGVPYAPPPRWGYGAGYGPGRGFGAGRGLGLGLGMKHRHRHGRGRWRWFK